MEGEWGEKQKGQKSELHQGRSLGSIDETRNVPSKVVYPGEGGKKREDGKKTKKTKKKRYGNTQQKT